MKCDESPDVVEEHLNESTGLLTEFMNANEDVLLFLPEDEKDGDQMFWFNPKKNDICSFITEVENWITAMRKQNEDAVGPDDSVSITGAQPKKKSSSHVSQSAVSS
ncbi:hypothetical protein ILYODFUR_038492 [Ilyodon furcidens]|uniref:Uncharacterized protein n=1 Tax=Ilyodon furcidens TaxID=33524 RepID=A0ABV0UD66_9TELE